MTTRLPSYTTSWGTTPEGRRGIGVLIIYGESKLAAYTSSFGRMPSRKAKGGFHRYL